MLFLHLASFLPHIADRLALLLRRQAAPGIHRAHAPLQGTLVRLR